jgi:YebC/PmpR family DNA-binding regulatory protein
MSGHSKWATIKRQKAVTDSKRGAAFTRLGKNISIAARKGKDPEMNAALRVAIEKAREANVPKDNIERAILKGAGELPGMSYEEARYEGFGPGGVALIVECVSDNTNRTLMTLRGVFADCGGTLGNPNSVAYLFDQKGVIRIARSDFAKPEDALELLAIDAGAEDIETDENGMTIMTAREQLHAVVQSLHTAGINLTSSETEWVPKTLVDVTPGQTAKVVACIEALEEEDDVEAVTTNARL